MKLVISEYCFQISTSYNKVCAEFPVILGLRKELACTFCLRVLLNNLLF